jgi:hypothetical protein
MRPKLRLFTGNEDGGVALENPTVPMNFGEFTRLVADAGRFERTWLSDFHDDDIQVPEDLFEVLTAYRRMRPGA